MRRKTRLFGISLVRRKTRRRLVVTVYAVLVALVALSWRVDNFRSSGLFLFWIVFFVQYLLFGSYAKPRPRQGKSLYDYSPLLDLRLKANSPALERIVADNPEDEPGPGDEREVARRDRVHYQAYQVLAICTIAMWQLAWLALHRPHWMPATLLPVLLYLVALPSLLLALTLPQAILLWTEPDMPDEDLAVEANGAA